MQLLDTNPKQSVMGYMFKKKVKANDDWFDTPLKSVVIRNLITDECGLKWGYQTRAYPQTLKERCFLKLHYSNKP